MDKYEAVRDQIRRAQIQRSVFIAELLSDVIVDSWNGIKKVTASLLGQGRARTATRTNVFTFDA